MLKGQLQGLVPLAKTPGVAAAMQILTMHIDQLTAENQRDVERLQVLQRRLNDLYGHAEQHDAGDGRHSSRPSDTTSAAGVC